MIETTVDIIISDYLEITKEASMEGGIKPDFHTYWMELGGHRWWIGSSHSSIEEMKVFLKNETTEKAIGIFASPIERAVERINQCGSIEEMLTSPHKIVREYAKRSL